MVGGEPSPALASVTPQSARSAAANCAREGPPQPVGNRLHRGVIRRRRTGPSRSRRPCRRGLPRSSASSSPGSWQVPQTGEHPPQQLRVRPRRLRTGATRRSARPAARWHLSVRSLPAAPDAPAEAVPASVRGCGCLGAGTLAAFMPGLPAPPLHRPRHRCPRGQTAAGPAGRPAALRPRPRRAPHTPARHGRSRPAAGRR